MTRLPSPSRAVFLDRDGVLVIPEFRDGRSFAPTKLDQFAIYAEALGALDRLKAAGFLLIVVTNQPDIANGRVEISTVEEMHQRLRRALPVDSIKCCPHNKEKRCGCRKPAPGLILEAASEFGIDLTKSYMVGDRASDVAAGRAAGCKTVFIELGYANERAFPPADFEVRNVAEAASVILGQDPDYANFPASSLTEAFT